MGVDCRLDLGRGSDVPGSDERVRCFVGNDIWIAALARQTGLPVATTDDHFDRVTNLAVLKW